VGRTQERSRDDLRLTFSRAAWWPPATPAAHKEANGKFDNKPVYVTSPFCRLARMNEYVFVGLVTIAITLFAMGVMNILAVGITALNNLL
jgi:hypothetical protein